MVRLSIVVITYNRRELLKRCLTSLLEQDFPVDSLQIVVSDDGSTDGTREMVEGLARENSHLLYVYQPHRGIPAARNSGLKAAHGDVIAFLADDYQVAPDYAMTVVSFLKEWPEAKIVRFKVVSDRDHFWGRLSQLFYQTSVCRRVSPRIPYNSSLTLLIFYPKKMLQTEEVVTVDHDLEPAGGAAFRREVFEIVGLFDESLARGEDTDMKLRLKRHGIPIHYYPFHEIRHHYDRLPFATLRRCYLSGLWRVSLEHKYGRKYGSAPRSVRRINPRSVIRSVNQRTAGLLFAWHDSQSNSIATLFIHLPFMLVFRAASRIGYLVGLCRQYRWWSQKTEDQ